MLSLVHGPVDVACLGGETLRPAAGMAVWHEGLGFVVYATSGSTFPDNLYLVKLDGTAVRIGSRMWFSSIGWRHEPGAPERDDLPVLNSTWYGAFVVRLPSTYPVASGVHATGATFASLGDRALMFSGLGVWATVGGLEYSFVDPGVSGDGQIMPAALGPSSSRWWCVNRPSGRAYLYDAIAKAEVAGRRTGLGSSVHAAGYSRKHDVFVVMRYDAGRDRYTVSAYANEAQASTVNVTPLAGVVAGRSYPVSTRILGDLGEPCAGRVVEFAASAGEVTPAGVETDADGWARSTYRAPRAPASGVTVTATLVE